MILLECKWQGLRLNVLGRRMEIRLYCLATDFILQQARKRYRQLVRSLTHETRKKHIVRTQMHWPS